MSASTLLRSSRAARGLSQRDLAAACGVRQPGVAAVESGAEDATVGRLERLLAGLGRQLTLLPSGPRPVWAAAEDVRNALADHDERSAWREVIQLNDDLRAAEPATRVALSVTAPAPTGDPRFDALLAAVTDFVLSRSRLPRPSWLTEDEWTLAQPWDVEDVPALRVAARAATPASIKRHGIYLDHTVLEST